MKKNLLKSLLICIVGGGILLGLAACSNAVGGFPTNSGFVSAEKIAESHFNEINKFGTNPTIYKSTSRNARFYNGQHLNKPFWGMYNDITFESNLVKYDSINPTVMAYVEKMDDNAMMHHHYDIDFVKENTYVEFASYIDMANGEVIMCEVRIFKGDYLDTWNRKRQEGVDPWYAKSVTLSPDFKIDIQAEKNIITGENATYKYTHAIYEGQAEDNSPEHNKYKDDLKIDEASYLDGDITTRMNKLGINPVHYDKNCPITCINTDEYFVISRLFEYDSLTTNAEAKYTELNDNGWLLWTGGYKIASFDKSKRYIELMAFVNRASNKITSYQLRFKIPNLETNKHKAKGICLTPAQFNELTN